MLARMIWRSATIILGEARSSGRNASRLIFLLILLLFTNCATTEWIYPKAFTSFNAAMTNCASLHGYDSACVVDSMIRIEKDESGKICTDTLYKIKMLKKEEMK